MRTTVVVMLTLAAAAAPLRAQSATVPDPTRKVIGNGKLPDGWLMRFDRPQRGSMPAVNEINFVTMGGGFHFATGPAAIYYNPKDTASGEYVVSAKFAQTRSMGHEAYGIFIGGSSLQDSAQRYVYFLVRPYDGGAMIQLRTSNARPTQQPRATPPTPASPFGLWMPESLGVNKDNPASGAATNELTIRVGKDSVQFLANGKPVRIMAKKDLRGMSTDGQIGLRINHNLDLHVSDFVVKK